MNRQKQVALGVQENVGGPSAFEQFVAAPAELRTQFWAALRKRTDWEHELAGFREEIGDPDAPPPIEMRRREPARVRWDWRWEKRAARMRQRTSTALRDRERTLEAEKDRLLEVPSDLYIETLTGAETGARRQTHCPLPDHDDRSPSFYVYPDNTWRCFGCGEHGNIYELAGLMWDLPRSGRDFIELHRRLVEMFL